MKTRHLLLVLSLSALVLAGTATSAAASCAMPPGSLKSRLNDASIVFVGTVDSADQTGRIANVTVESVWSGDVGDHVQVKGGPAEPQTVSSVDRGFDVGQRYLFAPVSGNGQVFEDNICTDTQKWNKKLERHRPEGAAAVSGPPPAVDPEAEGAADEGDVTSGPAATSTATSSNLGWIVGTAVLALLVLAGVAVLRRRGGAASAS